MLLALTSCTLVVTSLLYTWTHHGFTTQIRQVQNHSAKTTLVPAHPVKFIGACNEFLSPHMGLYSQHAPKLTANLAIHL